MGAMAGEEATDVAMVEVAKGEEQGSERDSVSGEGENEKGSEGTTAPGEDSTDAEMKEATAEESEEKEKEEESEDMEVNLYASLDAAPAAPPPPLALASSFSHTVRVQELHSYKFGTKRAQAERDRSDATRLARLQERYRHEGMRRSVEGVLLVHEHRHPYVLLLQMGNSFKLPGGKLRPGESDIDGLKRKLTTKLGPALKEYEPEWHCEELVCKWWRPDFEPDLYPYVPPHVTKPKECRKVYLVSLPEKCYFAVPKNLRLLAVPLFDLYANADRYGPTISSLPQLLGKFDFVYM